METKTETKYAYQVLIEKHKLQIADLPSDAKIGIEAIKNLDKSIKLAKSVGRTVSQGTLDKIKANDKWVVMEILDFVEDTDKNAEDMPFEEEEIIDEIKEGDIKVSKTEDVKPVEAVAPLSAEVEKGLAIEKELALAYESGKRTITLDELRSISKTAYNVVFDTYDESGENGLETTMYDLTETDDEVFTLTKK